MQRYDISGMEISEGDEGFPAALSRAYSLREKPFCLCRRGEKLPLYISLRHGTHVLSRWPGTGAGHAPGCDHYEAPDVLTGLGQVKGSAIIENQETGQAELRLAFPLSRVPARAAPSALTNDKPAIKSTGQRLTMRGLLHFLWDRAQLTHWHPRMANKRNWYVVRRALLSAALTCTARGRSFTEALFIPEVLNIDRKAEILARRRLELAPAYASHDAIMLVIAELKSIEAVRFGERIVLRHLPDWAFSMDKDMARRFHQRFEIEQRLVNANGAMDHMVMAASFCITQSGPPEIIEVSIMPVTREWLPFESLDEHALITMAVHERRHFVKGLRVNLGSEVPIASIALTDTGEAATAVFLERNHLDAAFDEATAALMRTPGVSYATWTPGRNLPDPHTRIHPGARSNTALSLFRQEGG